MARSKSWVEWKTLVIAIVAAVSAIGCWILAILVARQAESFKSDETAGVGIFSLDMMLKMISLLCVGVFLIMCGRLMWKRYKSIPAWKRRRGLPPSR